MVKGECGKDELPSKYQANKQDEVLDLDPHGQKIAERKCCCLVVKCNPCCQGKGKDHDQKVEELVGSDQNLAVVEHGDLSGGKLVC